MTHFPSACHKLLTVTLLIFTSLLLFVRCADVEEPKEPKRLALLIFPDVTSSIDSATFDTLKTNLTQILQAVPYGTHVELIPVSERRNPPARSAFTFPDQPTEPVKRECLTECADQRERIVEWVGRQQTVLDDVRQRYQATSSTRRSCILNAVERVENRARNLLQREDIDHVHSLILSDMIEECDDTAIGRVNFITEPMEVAIQKVDTWDQARNWEMLRDSDVQFSIIPQTATSSKRDLEDNPEEFWRPFFAQFGQEGVKWDLNREVDDIRAILSGYGDHALSSCEEMCD